ncbi:hypothetical protein H4S02_001481 [Coemansia sp. RSA 2611]|nr:hypothetical protein H4S02_001481 [Coemansia sp. RSA 2611]
MYTLKSHSFSGLSEGMVDSAFHTASSASESSNTDGLGAKHPWQLVEPAIAWPTASQRLGRRRTLPASSSIYEPDSDALRQEGNREAIQSLLIFECWARFLDASAREHVTIPEAERLYLTERLPLNITHLPQPLLCRSDMLASQITASNGLDAPAGDDGNKGAPIVRHVVPSRSLQFQPHEQLKQNIISHISKQGLCAPYLDTIRWLTGTLYPSPQLGLAGTLNWNTCGSLHYKLAPLGSYVSGTLRSAELVGTTSAQTLWSLLSDPAAGTGVLGRLVRFMLRKHSSGDQWQINLGSRWIRVLDPSVLADQCQSVGHQLAILIFVCSAIAAVLFLIF